MGRRVFISVLGTGFYGQCRYSSGDKFVSSPTRFVQQAMLEFHDVRSWNENDKAYILLTSKARTANWYIPSGKRFNKTTNKEEEYQGLDQILANLRNVEDVDIPDGKNEDEMWQIFSKVFELLQDGDELYIDLTHSFRYLPMLLLVLTNYAHFLKDIEVKAVSYGNYEARDKAKEIAPIVDLLPLVALQRWTFAAANFLRNGDVSELGVLSYEVLKPILRDPARRNNQTVNLRRYIDNVTAFVDQLKFCRGKDIYSGASVNSLQNIALEDSVFIKPLNPILDKVSQSLSDFSVTQTAANQIEAAKWCYKRGQYQASVTLLQEGIVTFFCDLHGIKPRDKYSKRKIVNNAFVKRSIELNPDSGPYESLKVATDEEMVTIVASDSLMQDKWVQLFSTLSDLRNDFNHAGMNQNAMQASNLKTKIKESLDEVEAWLLPEQCHSVSKVVPKPKVLVNLSNHPSAGWGAEQLVAARAFGEIEDVAFPQVDPLADADEIAAIADELTEAVAAKARDHSVTVHVMGEMTLLVAVVSRLQARGIRCVASTTERIVKMLPDGTKQSEFVFKQFRDYGC